MARDNRVCGFGSNRGDNLSDNQGLVQRGGVQIFQSVSAVFLDTVCNPVDIYARGATF